MGCVQSTGVDDEAKARKYLFFFVTPHLLHAHRVQFALCTYFILLLSKAMTRLRASSRRTA